jgi:hypothetical protein
MFLLFAFTSPLTIQLLVHLGISPLAAASDLTFKIAPYVLLKLAVVPSLCTVMDAQELEERPYSTCPLPQQTLAQAKTLATEPYTR